jgi:hypothetical protein
VVHYAQVAVLHQAAFSYTQGPQRSELFHRHPGDFRPTVHSDCSQFVSALYHWVGVAGLTDTDYTGTLLEKGKPVVKPKAADTVIFGGGTGEHAALVTWNGFTIGFGHSPGAPNRVKLADMVAWFQAHGHPGVRFLAFLP